MSIEFACESCKKLLRVPDGSGGLSCQCPACQTLLEIPDPAAIKLVHTASSQNSGTKVKVACPKCGVELACGKTLLGTKGQCRNCKYIFTISTDRSATSAVQDSGWIFTCPKCDQLFAGKEEMRGRRGKCHSCGEVFTIALRRSAEQIPNVGDSSLQVPGGVTIGLTGDPPDDTIKPPNGPAFPSVPAPAGSPKSPEVPEYPKVQASLKAPEPSKAPVSPKAPRRLTDLNKPKSPGYAQSTASSGKQSPNAGAGVGAKSGSGAAGHAARTASKQLDSNIRITCSSCHGIMEVPESSAGMTTACPYCQQLLAIPTPTGTDAAQGTDPSHSLPGTGAVRGAQGTDPSHSLPWTDAARGALGTDPDQFLGTDPDQFGSLVDLSGATMNPYSATVPELDPGMSGTAPGFSGYTAPIGGAYSSRGVQRAPIVYILPGVMIVVLGVLQILGVAINILASLGQMSAAGRLNTNQPEVQGVVIFFLAHGLIVLVLSVMQIVGGFCMARRRGLWLARTSAVIACLPCFTCLFLNMPFGIWGLVVCLTGSVKMDFRHRA